MGTVDDFKVIIEGLKFRFAEYPYDKIRKSNRARKSVSSLDTFSKYFIQYYIDCRKETFYIPSHILLSDALNSGSCINFKSTQCIVSYIDKYYQIEGKTCNDVVYKGIASNLTDLHSLVALRFNENIIGYSNEGMIFSPTGKLLFGLFGKIVHKDDNFVLENFTVKVDPSVYTEVNDLNKVIIKYIIPNLFYTNDNSGYYKGITSYVFSSDYIPTVMEVSDTTGLLSTVTYPSINKFSNEEIRQLVLDNVNLL